MTMTMMTVVVMAAKSFVHLLFYHDKYLTYIFILTITPRGNIVTITVWQNEEAEPSEVG